MRVHAQSETLRGENDALASTQSACLGAGSRLRGHRLRPDKGHARGAKDLATKAAAYVKANGADAAIKAFNAPGGDWHKADLYVFVIDPTGLYLAGNPTLVGKNIGDRSYVKEFLATKDTGWVNYSIVNPTTQKEEPKTSYVIRVGDNIVGVGAYKPTT
jgi:hypothetical protein